MIPDKVEERVDTAEDCEWDKLNSTRDQEDTSDFVGDSKIKVHLQAPWISQSSVFPVGSYIVCVCV